jgi:hypothetical protein
MIPLILIFGIFLGFFISKGFDRIKQNINTKKDKKWKVKFHTYFLIHEKGNLSNNVIHSPSIEVYVNAESEDEASDLVIEMIEKEFRIEIESTELWLI